MALRFRIRLSGASGQGLLQAGRILAEAAAIYDDKKAAESCAYGPESRGSAAKVDIIISDAEIDYPKIEKIDCLIALTQEAFDRYAGALETGGTVIIESGIDTAGTIASGDGGDDHAGGGDRVLHAAPFGAIAEEACGRRDMMYLAALGFFAAVSDVIGEQSIRQAVLARAPKSCESFCMEAYDAGLRAGRER
jgi:2-oxoglutarate ferredoxin oxidoreductase subunit gamma